MITLRDFKMSDVGRLVDILNQPSVTQFLSTKIPSPYTKEDATWWIQEGSKEGFIRAVEYDGELVGCIGVNPGQGVLATADRIAIFAFSPSPIFQVPQVAFSKASPWPCVLPHIAEHQAVQSWPG